MPLSRNEKIAITLGVAGAGAVGLLALLRRPSTELRTFSGTYLGNGAAPNLVPLPFKPHVLMVEFGGAIPAGSAGHAMVYLADVGIEAIQVGGIGSASGFQTSVNLSTFYSNGQLDIGALQTFLTSIQSPTPFNLNQAGRAYTMSIIG